MPRAPGTHPSTLYFNGRAVLTPAIIAHLKAAPRIAGEELQLTHALAAEARAGMLLGVQSAGRTFDCGSFQGLSEAAAHVLAAQEARER